MKWFFIAAAVTTFAVTLAIIATLVVDAIEFLQGIADTDEGLGSLFTIGWFPRRGMFDIGTLVVGTFIVTGIAMLVAVPLGIGAAIYLSEYARPKVRKTVKPILEILAGVPSVVLGYFAIAYINPNIIVEPVLRRQCCVHTRRGRYRCGHPDDSDHRIGRRGRAVGGPARVA